MFHVLARARTCTPALRMSSQALPAVCVCVDLLETPGIYAIWQPAHGGGWRVTLLNSSVCVCV